MLHIKLADRRPARSDDPMGRKWWGYDPTVPVDQLFEINRGRWVLGPRADRERHVAFSYTGDHEIKFVAEIDRIDRLGKRRVIVGRVLDADHPLSRKWVGAEAPNNFRNPVSYVKDPSDPSMCACGCGEQVTVGRSFVPGHDQRAVHERITKQWGGTIGFIDWFDATFGDERFGN